MLPQITSLIEARDFLTHLMTLAPGDAESLLFNSGEDLIVRLNASLGIDAFKEGDTVLVEPGSQERESFVGSIVGKRLSSDADDATAIFTVEGGDGSKLDCTVSELQLEDAS